MSLAQDVRFGFRVLAKQPGFTAAAVLVLAVGIGATTAIFSLMNAFLLKPLLISHPEQIVGVYSRDTQHPDSYRAFSYPEYTDLRAANGGVFSELMAHNLALAGLEESGSTRRIFLDIVSANYFAAFGVPLYRGRPFTLAEEQPGAGLAVTILGYSEWQKRGADPDGLGKTVRINGRVYTIIGIAPPGFTGTTAVLGGSYYMPLGMYEALINDFEGHGRKLADRGNHNLILVGRLRDDMTQDAADRQLAAVATRMREAEPVESKDQTIVVRPLSRLGISTNPSSDKQAFIPAALLLAVAGVVLLIASLNVANMMLARATARRKEMAIRLALGGRRANIVQQLFTEGLLLALAGSAAGLLLSYWGTTALVRSLQGLLPIDLVFSARPDARVLAATIAFCVLSTLLFSVGPALSLARAGTLVNLKDNDAAALAGGKPRRLFSSRNLLAMGQLSLSLALLTAAGLFVRSAVSAAGVRPGFEIEDRILAEIDPSLAGYDQTKGRQLYSTLLDRIQRLPGVESASLAATVPFGTVSLGRSVQRSTDDTARRETFRSLRYNIVTADYFQTLGVPLLRGRTFSPAEMQNGAVAPVAIIDEAAAKKFWPDGDAIGKHLRTSGRESDGKSIEMEVVGVVADVSEGIIARSLEPHLYLPFGQNYQANMTLHVKSALGGVEGERQMLELVRREVRAVDDRLPLLELRSLRTHMDRSMDLWLLRTGARMLGLFAAVALLLAMIGLYAVRAYAVARRTREIGIRMALGASTRHTLALVLREGVAVAAVGLGLGALISVGTGRLLASVLYGVSGFDPLVLVGAPALLAVVAVVACYVPARRAALVDPMVALRYE
jgi:predicted permease